MKTFIGDNFSNTLLTIAVVFATVFVVAPILAQSQFAHNLGIQTQTVHAWGGGGSSGGGGGGTGGGNGCGGCGTGSTGGTTSTTGHYNPPPPPAATCNYLNVSATTVTPGQQVTLNWSTSNATNVTLNGNPVSGTSQTMTVNGNTTYTLTASNITGSGSCTANVTVQQPPSTPPSCDSFTASPTVLPYGGGSVNLVWQTTNADSVSINNGVGTVAADGSQSVNVTNSTTYILTVHKAGYNDVTCPAAVTVQPQTNSGFSCANNVQFSADKTSLPYPGGDVNLTWNTTGADTVSISDVGTNLALSGNQSVNVSSSKTFTLTATKGSQTINCPLPVSVGTYTPPPPPGGGGGGVVWPYCQLYASVKQIQPGQSVQLTWKTMRATNVTLGDDHGNVLFDTPNTAQFNGSLTVQPTQTTTYTLVAHRGSIDLPCPVTVHVPQVPVTVLQVRNQQPLLSGISLTQVPYTGFDAGPFLTLVFYVLLTIWGLFVAYVFVIRRKQIAGISLPGAHTHVPYTDVSVDAPSMEESSLAEGYVQSATPLAAPANLPVAPMTMTEPVVGYAAQAAAASVADTIVTPAALAPEAADESIAMTELENRAHAEHALLSSDAMRYFMNATKAAERNDVLDATIRTAKETFPSEDGWVVLNLSRMESLLTDPADANGETMTETAPITSGSLAEAMTAGNIVAAYAMISSRPMIALADAAADLDAVYRSRKGATVSISDLLKQQTAGLTDEQLHNAIAALTGAIDGTYTTEAEAVKMAILKAVKALA